MCVCVCVSNIKINRCQLDRSGLGSDLFWLGTWQIKYSSKIYCTKIDSYSYEQLLSPLHWRPFCNLSITLIIVVCIIAPSSCYNIHHILTYVRTILIIKCLGLTVDEVMKRMTKRIFRKLYGLEKKVIKVYGDVPHTEDRSRPSFCLGLNPIFSK